MLAYIFPHIASRSKSLVPRAALYAIADWSEPLTTQCRACAFNAQPVQIVPAWSALPSMSECAFTFHRHLQWKPSLRELKDAGSNQTVPNDRSDGYTPTRQSGMAVLNLLIPEDIIQNAQWKEAKFGCDNPPRSERVRSGYISIQTQWNGYLLYWLFLVGALGHDRLFHQASESKLGQFLSQKCT